MFKITKTFGHDLGISTCFRQHRATGSHCRFLHGYSLAFEFVIQAESLDARNWVFDFGGFSQIKKMLIATFDHKLVVAEDDPLRAELEHLADLGAADVLVLPSVGCERFAQYVFKRVREAYLPSNVNLISVTVHEHGANSATYSPHE